MYFNKLFLKNRFRSFLILFLSLMVVACGGGDPVTLQSITVSPSSESIAAGLTQQFTAMGHYSDGTSQVIAAPIWSSSISAVATVDASGLVSSLMAGSTTITATFGGLNGSASLTVTAATLQSITVSSSSESIAAGLTQQFTAIGHYSDGTSQVIATPTWNSSVDTIATVNASGLVSSLAAGSTMISATFGGLTGSTPLTVTAAILESITLSSSSTSVAAGLTQQFTATGHYSDGTSQVLPTPTWSSSTSTVATVNMSGLVSSLATGSSTITATFGGMTGSASLTVTAAILESITVTSNTSGLVGMASGSTQQFTATGHYSDATSQVILTPIWRSSDNFVATVDSTGLVTAIGAGNFMIAATANGVSGVSANISVFVIPLPPICVGSLKFC